MRSFTDEHGIVGWIFDEYTHPRGLYFKKEQPVAVAPKKANLDVNGDGVVDKKDASIAGKILEKVKSKKK